MGSYVDDSTIGDLQAVSHHANTTAISVLQTRYNIAVAPVLAHSIDGAPIPMTHSMAHRDTESHKGPGGSPVSSPMMSGQRHIPAETRGRAVRGQADSDGSRIKAQHGVSSLAATGNGPNGLDPPAARNSTRTAIKTHDYHITVFNCHGFKQSFSYISKLLNDSDVACLTETWLRPCELPYIDNVMRSSNMSDKFQVFSKSAMCDIEPDYSGRPFGGVSIICKMNINFTYRELPVPSDRLIAVYIDDSHGNPAQIILNVYMPFYNSDLAQTVQFVNTIDTMQSFVDEYVAMAPIKIVGDYNVQLPHKDFLNPKWSSNAKINQHSGIMHDFLTGNNFLIADFMFAQPVLYTYSCVKTGVYTWINHMAFLEHERESVIYCNILSPDADNTRSDHLPIKMGVVLSVATDSHRSLKHEADNRRFPKLSWDNFDMIDNYSTYLQSNLETLPPYDPSQCIDIYWQVKLSVARRCQEGRRSG